MGICSIKMDGPLLGGSVKSVGVKLGDLVGSFVGGIGEIDGDLVGDIDGP